MNIRIVDVQYQKLLRNITATIVLHGPVKKNVNNIMLKI